MSAVLLHKPRPRRLSPGSHPGDREDPHNKMSWQRASDVWSSRSFALLSRTHCLGFPASLSSSTYFIKKPKKTNPQTKKHNSSVSQVCSVGRILALCKKGSVVTYLWETLESPSWWSHCMQSAAES